MRKTPATAVPGSLGIIGARAINGRNWIDFACQLPHLGNRPMQGLPNFMLHFKYSTMYYCLPFSTYRRKNFFRLFNPWFEEKSSPALLPYPPLKNTIKIFIK
jgi:hypothetical protein